MRSTRLPSACLLAVASAPAAASACLDGERRVEVAELSVRAGTAFDRGDYTVALTHYARIREVLGPVPACAAELADVRFYEGDALAELCRVDEALTAYADSLRGPLDDELRARVPGLLRVDCREPCVEFSIEGAPAGRLACGEAGLLRPGGHRVQGRATDGRTRWLVAVVSPGEETRVALDFAPLSPPPVAPPPAAEASPIPALTWVLGGTAVAALVGGITTNVLARGKVDDQVAAKERGDKAAEREAESDALDLAYTSYALFAGSGLLAAGAGVAFWLSFAPDSNDVVGSSGIQLGVGGRW